MCWTGSLLAAPEVFQNVTGVSKWNMPFVRFWNNADSARGGGLSIVIRIMLLLRNKLQFN